MNNVNLKNLVKKAGEMASDNNWGQDAYTINKAILEIDHNNGPSCTRLAKYYKMNDNIAEAKNMYLKALDIDPDSRIAINNLQAIEKDQKEKEALDKINAREVVQMGDKNVRKKEEKKKKAEKSVSDPTATSTPVKKPKKTY